MKRQKQDATKRIEAAQQGVKALIEADGMTDSAFVSTNVITKIQHFVTPKSTYARLVMENMEHIKYDLSKVEDDLLFCLVNLMRMGNTFPRPRQSLLAEKTRHSQPSVSRAWTGLVKKGVLTEIKEGPEAGLWFINPNLAAKGSWAQFAHTREDFAYHGGMPFPSLSRFPLVGFPIPVSGTMTVRKGPSEEVKAAEIDPRQQEIFGLKEADKANKVDPAALGLLQAQAPQNPAPASVIKMKLSKLNNPFTQEGETAMNEAVKRKKKA